MPIVVLSIITIIVILIFFYEESVLTSKLHRVIRCEAGLVSEKTIYYDEMDNRVISTSDQKEFNIESQGGIPFRKIYGKGSIALRYKGLVREETSSTVTGEWYAVSGSKFKRLR